MNELTMFYRKRMDDLEQWRSSVGRKPLIIRGARQVGKTTLVETFGKTFKQYLGLNLEKPKDAAFFHSYQDAQELTQQLFLEYGLDYRLRSETLLFIDEIQQVPTAVNMLRYFYEELPELPVIAAGSMLESLLGKSVSFPVGRVSYLMLRPFSFEEYLIATSTPQQIEAFQEIPVPRIAENLLFEKFTFYAFLGGMPAVIQHYIETKDITQLKPIFEELIESYQDDAEKYAQNFEQLQQLRFVIQQLGKEAGSRITFSGFGGMTYQSKTIAELFRMLEKTHLCKLIYPTVGQKYPIETDFAKAPRLHFLDTGLMNFVANIQVEVLRSTDLCTVYTGKMIEHLVGQELFAGLRYPSETPHFWVRQKRGSQAEIDYLVQHEGKLYPVEVKSGKTGKLKSLFVYMETSPVDIAIRLYAGEFSVDQLQTATGKAFTLINIPYFHASKIDAYIQWFSSKSSYEIQVKPSLFFREPAAKYKAKKEKEKQIKQQKTTQKPSNQLVLEACLKAPQSARYLLEDVLQKTFQTTNKRNYLQPLMEMGLLELTDKTNIKSRYQQYCITEKGVEFLATIQKE